MCSWRSPSTAYDGDGRPVTVETPSSTNSAGRCRKEESEAAGERRPTYDGSMIPARRLSWTIIAIAVLAGMAAAAPFLLTRGEGPSHHLLVRGEEVRLYGRGPYRHMPSEVALQEIL